MGRAKHVCGRCGLACDTRWDWAHHGCELTGPAGARAQLLGEAVRRRYPDAAGLPGALRLRDTYGAREEVLAIEIDRALRTATAPLNYELVRVLGQATGAFVDFGWALSQALERPMQGVAAAFASTFRNPPYSQRRP